MDVPAAANLSSKVGEPDATLPLLVVDIEATCCDQGTVPQLQMEVIQIGAVIANRSGIVLDEWSSYVRPIRHPELTDFCTRLTGIRQLDVDAADTFPVVIQGLMQWVSSNCPTPTSWASWGAYDHHQLRQDFEFHGRPWCLPSSHLNMKASFAKTRRLKKRPALATALTLVNMKFSGTPHNALDDARNAAKLLPYLGL